MKVIIIGGCGFIGMHTAQEFARNNVKTILVDTEKRCNLSLNNKKISMVDIGYPYSNLDILESIIKKGDVIIHLGWSDVPNDNPECFQKDISQNIMYSSRIFYSTVNSKASKIIFASSGGAVYGNSNQLPIYEDHETSPISSYGIAKLTAEKYLTLLTTNSSTDCAIFRIGNAYGAHFSSKVRPTGLIPVLIEAIKNDQKIEIWGDGKVIRDFVHVKDVANAFYLAATQPKITGIFNLGTGNGTSLLNLISLIESKFNKNLKVNWGKQRYCDVKCTILNSQKFIKVSGWKPEYNLDKGIDEMLAE